jgi:hypothetical protein
VCAFGGYAPRLVVDVQRSSPTATNGGVGEAFRGAHGRAQSPFGYEREHPGRYGALPSVLPTDSRPRKSRDDHLAPIAYVFFDAASGTEPHQVSVQVSARLLGPEITPARSSAVAATALAFTEFFGLAEFPSLTPRHHIEETNGVTDGLDRVAHSGVAGEQDPASASTSSSAAENLIRSS